MGNHEVFVGFLFRRILLGCVLLCTICCLSLAAGAAAPSEDTSSWPLCVDLSQKYCADLKKNKKVTLFDGQVDYSDLYKGNDFSVSQGTADFIRLREARLKFFPKDYQKAAKPFSKKWLQLLNKVKKASISQDHQLAFEWSQLDAQTEFSLQKVIRKRFYRKFPDLERKDPLLWTLENKADLRKEYWNFSREIFVTTYSDSKDWKRIQKVFDTAKFFLKEAILESNFESAKKEKMKEQIETITLNFPDEESLDGLDFHDCGSTTTKNAVYVRSHHQMIICLGTMVSYRSESSLFFTLAHELGHAIDPSSIVFEIFQRMTVCLKK